MSLESVSAFTDLYHAMPCHAQCLHAEFSRAPDYITNGHGSPMQTTSCTWPYVVPVGEDPAAHGHWCAFTDLYHAMSKTVRMWASEEMQETAGLKDEFAFPP